MIVNAILYLNRTGCAWRYLPSDFPPWRTVYGYFACWRDNGTLQLLHDGLRDQARTAAGRDLNSPSTQGHAKLPELKPKRFAMNYHLLAVTDGPRRVRVQPRPTSGAAHQRRSTARRMAGSPAEPRACEEDRQTRPGALRRA